MEKSLNSNLRKEYKTIRDNIPKDKQDDMSRKITENVLALLESDFKGANIFLCFYPFDSEVNLLYLYSRLLDGGKRLYFPVSDIKKHELSFFEVKDLKQDFQKGAYGIMEPIKDNRLDFTQDAIVITPGLIFDNNCNRIGYGAGFYDRFFSKNKVQAKIGIAFEQQLMEQIEVQAHDVPLDFVVTNDRLIKRG